MPSVVCFVFCPVLCGVLVSGCVLVPCCPALCCAGSCCVFCVFLCCGVRLRSLLVLFFFLLFSLPFPGASGCFCLCGALPWCVLLFGVALSRCVPVLVSAALCCLVLCCAVLRLMVLCCVVCFVSVLGSCLASSARVAAFCALSVPGGGAVSYCCAACDTGAVVPCPVFLGASRLVAPFVHLVLLPLWRWPVFCVVACCVCVFAVGPGCPLLSRVGSWWLLVCCGVSLGAVLRRVAACCAARCYVVVRCVVFPRSVWCCCALCRALGRCLLSWGPVPSGAVFCLVSPALCVFCGGELLRAVVRYCALSSVRPGVSCCAFPLLSYLCGAAVRRADCLVCAVSGASCCCTLLSVVPFPAVLSCVAARCAVSSFGLLCCAAACLLCLVVCYWVWLFSAVSCWVLGALGVKFPVVLSLSGRVARCLVVWCGVRWCSVPLCCVLWCCVVVWCCAVVLCCLFASLPVPVVFLLLQKPLPNLLFPKFKMFVENREN